MPAEKRSLRFALFGRRRRQVCPLPARQRRALVRQGRVASAATRPAAPSAAGFVRAWRGARRLKGLLALPRLHAATQVYPMTNRG